MCGFMYVSDTSITKEEFMKGFEKIAYRGPDMSKVEEYPFGYFGFHRLAIMGVDISGMQPMKFHRNIVVCNGEIYNFRRLKRELIDLQYSFQSESDCEVLLPMYQEYGVDMFHMLDAEYACVLYDASLRKVVAARDPIGIRPMFYGYTKNGKICFASEAKALMDICEEIHPFPIGTYYIDGKFVKYHDVTKHTTHHDDLDTIFKNIKEKLSAGVIKRLDSDVPVGFLLSGGLDSSLVCAIATKYLGKQIKTFAIGMDIDPIDLQYAREVADYIHSDHYEFKMTRDEVLEALHEVIFTLETFDITTIRASIGMYLICKKIKETSDVKVLLSGEISDELFGYKYTDFAPDANSFQLESEKRMRELYMYDVLRADRCISRHALEARVPFGDLDFVDYVLSIDPEKKLNTYGKGKYLLRKAFVDDYLPESILMREKAAFSDAVGHSLVDDIKEYANAKYSDEELEKGKEKYKDHVPPISKESLLYREIFEAYYPKQGKWIKDFWMPNKEWEGCNVEDPSARVLSNYGDSGK